MGWLGGWELLKSKVEMTQPWIPHFSEWKPSQAHTQSDKDLPIILSQPQFTTTRH